MDNEQNQNKNSRIIDVDLQNEMRKSFLDYSMSVIVSRALPDVNPLPVPSASYYFRYD